MSQIKLKNHTSRDGFDLSRKNAFTAKVGELLPIACLECIPGDNIQAKIQHFTRTMPVNTAAYTRIREYYDWFFVPTNLLWNKFNSFIVQTDEVQHALSINEQESLNLEHPYFTTSAVSKYISVLDEYVNNSNIFGYSRQLQTCKLLEYLGYGDFYQTNIGDEKEFRNNARLNPFPLLAYQKIYQDYFRHSQWEKAYAPAYNLDYMRGNLNMEIDLTPLYNDHNENMFDLRYCNWNKDLFMGLLPNAQYGAAASVVIPNTYNSQTNQIELITYNTAASPSNVVVPENQHNVYTSDGRRVVGYFNEEQINKLRSQLGLNDGFSILALRQAEALQRWKEITQSQQKNYKDQIEAHFGVSPDDALSERCHYIDGHVSSLDISEVTNTNITGDNAADIAGKGVGVGQGAMKFNTKVHGYLMCIYHAVPLLDYAIDGIKRLNLKSLVTDYAIPEFDRTGMVSVNSVELTNTAFDTAIINVPEHLGYAPRYYDYKQAIDEVHGAFINGGLGSWVAPVDKEFIKNYFQSLSSTLVRPDSLTYHFFKVNPATLNPIFAQSVDSSVMTDQLLINSSIDIKAVRNLDRNGLPY